MTVKDVDRKLAGDERRDWCNVRIVDLLAHHLDGRNLVSMVEVSW
jgi:hypothetical protein